MDILNWILIGTAWLVCGLGMWSFYVAEFPNPNPAQVIFVIFAWPGVLFVFGLVIFAGALIYFATWLGTGGLKSVDYKLAFSNAFKILKDRFLWGAVVGLIAGLIYVNSGLNIWTMIFVWLVIFLVINFLPHDKPADSQ